MLCQRHSAVNSCLASFSEIAVFWMSITAEVLKAAFTVTFAGAPQGSSSTEERN